MTDIQHYLPFSLLIHALVMLAIRLGSNLVEAMNYDRNMASTSNANSSMSQFCTSPSCNFFGQAFLSTLDRSVWFCDDFYEFVCSKNNQKFETLRVKVVESNLKSLLERKQDHTNEVEEESQNLLRLRDFYASCMNPTRESRGLERLVTLIQQLGGFPLGGEESFWNEQPPFDWVQMTARFREIGLKVDQFFEFGFIADGDHNRLKIDITKYHLLGNIVNIEEVINGLYPNQDVNPIKLQLIELSEFRADIRQILQSPKGWHYRYHIDRLQSEIPEIDWDRLLDGLVIDNRKFLDHELHIMDDEKVKAMAKLLIRTKPRVLANHMILSIIETFGLYITMPSRGSPMDTHMTGTSNVDRGSSARAKACLQTTSKNLGLALSVEYYKKYNTPGVVETTMELIESIRSEMILMVDEAAWIADPNTRERVKVKIRSMKFDVGISDRLLDPQTLEWFYRGLEMNANNFMENLLSINEIKYQIYLNDLINMQREQFEWVIYDKHVTVQSNAYYHHGSNRVYLMAGMLNRLHVDQLQLASVNFGVLGTRIAHEMMHAFDFQRIQWGFDIMKTDWADRETERQLKEKARCIKDQYNGLQPESCNWVVNGYATLLENMADNAGVEAAYRALDRWLTSHPQQPSLLADVALDARQLFWASYAVKSCKSLNNRRLIDVFRGATQCPPKFRVDITLMNTNTFSTDFECPLGSFMNPRHKCHIW